jgi:hypothetical protein
VFSRVASKLRESAHAPFGYAVVDEAQAWGLVALLIAVFPANLYMETHPAEAGAPGVAIPAGPSGTAPDPSAPMTASESHLSGIFDRLAQTTRPASGQDQSALPADHH